MFTPIYYLYLAVIDSYMHMHFLNRVKWLFFGDKFWILECLVFWDGGSTALQHIMHSAFAWKSLHSGGLWILVSKLLSGTAAINNQILSLMKLCKISVVCPFCNDIFDGLLMRFYFSELLWFYETTKCFYVLRHLTWYFFSFKLTGFLLGSVGLFPQHGWAEQQWQCNGA